MVSRLNFKKMRIKKTTITVEEEPYTGLFHIQVSVQHENGQSNCSANVELKSGETRTKTAVIAEKIQEILNDYVFDGTYES